MASSAPLELSLFAPYNASVALLGSWAQDKPQPMTRGDDGVWRATVELPDGEYTYAFEVTSNSYFCRGEARRVFDPYATRATRDNPPRSVLRVRGGRRIEVDYTWRHDDKPLPANEELVIYEMHVGDFSGGLGDLAGNGQPFRGTFAHATDKLDYLADLGVNAIELMPVKEFPDPGWGYSLSSLFAVENSYGWPEDLCRFVDECHGRGMRVLLDGVYNHADKDCPLAQIDYGYWFYEQNPDPPHMDWGPKYNFTHHDPHLKVYPARRYVLDSIRSWVSQFHLDGIRFDATAAIRDFDVLREFASTAFEAAGGLKPFLTVAEHIPEDPAIVGYPQGGPMVAAWHETLARQLQALALEQEKDGAQPFDLDRLHHLLNPATNGFGSANHVINYLATHDHDRILHQLGATAARFGEAAFKRIRLAAGVLMASPGLPMIWMGQEFGVAHPKRLDPQPIDWALLRNDDNRGLREFYRRAIQARRELPALRAESYQRLAVESDHPVLAFKRWNDQGSVVIVLANLRDQDAGGLAVTELGVDDGECRDWFSEDRLRIESGRLIVTLGPSQVRYLVRD